MVIKRLFFFVCLFISFVLLILFFLNSNIINSLKNIDFFSSKFISQELQGLGNENQRIEKAFLDEYQPTKEGEEQIFLDKKFFDNGKYIISSLNSYSAEWYPSGHPKEDLKKLVVELQVTDKLTWKNFSLRGTADIPKYYYGSFDFDTSATDFVVFKDLSPSFTWEYSEKYEVVSVEKNELSLFQDGDIKTQTFVTEKKFNDYTLIDETIKKDIPLDLFLDPAISACGTLNSAGATYDLTTHVSTVTPGTCFTVTAANVTLDCHGYWVNYSGATPSRYGVYTNQFNTTVKNCKINNFNTTGGYYDSIGIAFWGADNGTILNCYANNSNSAGIYLTGNANYNNITSSMGITANSSQGMRLHDCHYNILLNNLATTKTNEGLGITGGSSYNIIINQTATSNSGRGVFFWQGAHDNVFIGLNASTLVSGEAIRIHNATNNIIMDCVSLDGASYDVYYYTELGSTGNVFLNCNYDTEYVTTSNSLIRKWYYQAYVNYSNSTAAAGVNVSGYNTSSVLQFTADTNSSGWIQRQNVTEYINNGGTRIFYNNYTINANKTSTSNDTNIFNFTVTKNKVNDFFTLTYLGGETVAPTITFESPTPNNASSTTSPVTIVANISDASNTSSWIDFDRSLVGYWAMDYYSATGVYDNSSWGNNLLYGGGASTSNIETGVRGDAFALDRDGADYLYRGTLALGSSATFEAWGYAYDLNDNMPMLWNHPTSTYTSYYDLFFLSNTICLNTGDSGSNPFKYPNGTNIPLTSISLNEWHHYVVVVDENLNQALLYFDGVYLGNASYKDPTSTTSRTFYLGGPSSGYRWNGSIDEFRLYNRSLSAAEVKAAYNSKVNKFNTSAISLADGQHNYTVYAIDEFGNIANSGLRNFNIGAEDTTFPIINWVNPTPDNQDTTSEDFVYLNTTITESNSFSAWFDWNKSLVGYWSFDYYNSTHVYDNSSYKGNGSFQGTLSTSDLVDGERGEGLDFDGDDYIVVGQPDQLNIDPDNWSYSILGWMKISPGQTGYLVCKGDSSTGTRQYGVFIQNDLVETYIGGTSSSSGVNISDNTWHHVALTFSSSSNGILYVDGKPRTSSILRGSATNTYDVLIGGRRNSGNTGLGYPLTGSLDEVMIFNRTLSPEEVNASYNAGSYRLYNNFTGLDQGTYDYSAYAIDESGNLNITLDREITLSSGETDSPSIIFELPTPSNTSTASNPVTIVANISDASNTSSWIDFDRTLVGYWAMDYYNSTGIYDNSSWDNFGSFVSGTGINGISSGVRGDSLEFYGNGSRLNMGKLGSSTAETFNSSGQLTFSVWINPDTISWQGIMGTNTVRFHMAAPSRIRSGIYNATAQYQFDSPDILSTGQWQHVALTYNRSNGNASSYHNGVLVGSRIILNANLTGAGDYFNVGQNWGDYFDGRLDEAMVFNRTLSQTEIKALYDSKSNKFNTSAMNLADAQHNYTVYAIDEYGNTASSGLRNFNIGAGDLTSPTITFEEPPTPANGSTTSSFVEIAANISDASNTSSWIDIDKTLVGYWAMDYANSTHVYDNSSYKNNATFQGGLSFSNITTGVRGEGMDFVGDGGELGIKYSSQYNITEGITLAIWMKRTTTYTQTRDMHLLSRYPAWYFYDAYNSGYVRGDVFIDGVRRGGIYTEVIPNDGNWYHIVYTYNSTTGYARMYTNGVQVDSTNLTGLSNYLIDGNTTADLSDMGWHNLGRGVVLDEAMIFSRSLSQSEVKALYSSQINKFNTSNLSYSDGQHNYTVYAIDEYGNTASSGERNFDVSSGLDCGTLSSSGVYTLTQNVSSTGTCFTVAAANVTIDCNGYWINYSTGGAANTYGVYTNQFNTTIKNCNIVDGNWGAGSSREGIYLVHSNRSTIFNSFLNISTGSAVLINEENYTYGFHNISFNKLFSNFSYTVYIGSAPNNLLFNNTITNSWIGTSIRIEGESINNNITSNIAISDSGGSLWFNGASNNSVRNNNFTSNSGRGILNMVYSYNNVFINNTVRCWGLGNAVDIWSDSDNIILINNTVTSNSSYGIYVYSSSNSTLIGNNATSNTSSGIYIHYSNNNTLTNNIATSITYHGIDVRYSNNNILTKNNGSSFGNISAGSGIFIYSSLNNTLTNNFGESFIGGGFYLSNSSNNNLTNNIGKTNSNVGIGLDSSPNNTLTNNTGTSNSNVGISLDSSPNNTLINNKGISNSGHALYLISSSNNTLTNNNATSNSSYGIYLLSSSNNNLTGNNGTSDIRDGFRITSSSNNTLTNNIGISNSSEGIQIDASSNITLFSNKGISTSGFGIHLSSSSNNNLTGNNGTSNSNDAIYLYYSNNSFLINNLGKSIIGSGIYLHYSFNNTLINNTGRSDSVIGLSLVSALYASFR